MARSLVKSEQAEDEKDSGEKSDSERQNVATKEKNSDSHNASDNVNVDATCTDREKAEQPAGKSQYEKTKEKNIAKLQDILADLNASYPIPAELEEKASKT